MSPTFETSSWGFVSGAALVLGPRWATSTRYRAELLSASWPLALALVLTESKRNLKNIPRSSLLFLNS